MYALLLMNNTVFVESARFMAERMLHQSDSGVGDGIRYGFRLACGRHPNDLERSVLQRSYHQFLQSFSDDVSAARKLLSVGDAPRDLSPPDKYFQDLGAGRGTRPSSCWRVWSPVVPLRQTTFCGAPGYAGPNEIPGPASLTSLIGLLRLEGSSGDLMKVVS